MIDLSKLSKETLDAVTLLAAGNPIMRHDYNHGDFIMHPAVLSVAPEMYDALIPTGGF